MLAVGTCFGVATSTSHFQALAAHPSVSCLSDASRLPLTRALDTLLPQVCDHPALLSERAANAIVSGASRARRVAAARLGGGGDGDSDVEAIEDSSEEELELEDSEEEEWETGA